jgi:GTPase SAR1 family protein
MCKEIHNKICQAKQTRKPAVVLVGNKKDMEIEGTISDSEIKEFCSRRDCKYIKVSAKTGDGVQEAFVQLVREMQRKIPSKPKPQFSRRCAIF